MKLTNKIIIVYFFYLILNFNLAVAQEKKIVAISSKIGTKLDRRERDIYQFFPQIKNFISARFFKLSDLSYQVEIKYFEEGKVKTIFWNISK